jgi:hypothetical protein
MTTSASRQMRSARNALLEALALGETYPLVDLPVSAEPPVASFGSIARVLIEDSERTLIYRLHNQDGQPLPGGVNAKASGTGAVLAIDAPPIVEDITFTVHAERPNGRAALLTGNAQVRVGLDDSLSVTIFPSGPVPAVIDHGAAVEIEVALSQEGVIYRLVGRQNSDTTGSGDGTSMDDDIALSDKSGVPGTGNNIKLTSIPLLDDTTIYVRAAKYFGGPSPKPPQTALLKATLQIFVRPDAELAVTATPAIVDHGGKSEIKIAKSATGVSYTLYGKPIADAEFNRLDPANPSLLVVPVPDGDVKIVAPPPTTAWENLPGYQQLGEATAGTGKLLSLPIPGLLADTMIVVEARKDHEAETGNFTSAERLAQPVAVLVRPDPKPKLRLAARIVGGKLTELSALSGQAGVFYALAAAAPIGELYLHQLSPGDPASNKGIGALTLTVDLVIAAGAPIEPTSKAPPPVPRVDVEALALPVDLTVNARRAMTGLVAEIGKAKVARLPKAEVQPSAVAAGGSAKLAIEKPVDGERYAIMVDGRLVGDPIAGAGTPLLLDTGPLAPGDRVELWAMADDLAAAIQVERVTPLDVAIG